MDFRGDLDDVLGRLSEGVVTAAGGGGGGGVPTARTPGRPRFGVVGREVTLLPRHWEWLNAQPGGASVALRKLVERGGTRTKTVIECAVRRRSRSGSCRRWRERGRLRGSHARPVRRRSCAFCRTHRVVAAGRLRLCRTTRGGCLRRSCRRVGAVRVATRGDLDTLLGLMGDFYAESGYVLDRPRAAEAFAHLLGDPRLGRVWDRRTGRRRCRLPGPYLRVRHGDRRSTAGTPPVGSKGTQP